jgi:hypothetical protein
LYKFSISYKVAFWESLSYPHFSANLLASSIASFNKYPCFTFLSPLGTPALSASLILEGFLSKNFKDVEGSVNLGASVNIVEVYYYNTGSH